MEWRKMGLERFGETSFEKMKQGWNESGNTTMWEVVVNLSLRQYNVWKAGKFPENDQKKKHCKC